MIITSREKLLHRTLILERQAGNVSGTMSYILRTPIEDNKKKNALEAQLKCDLGDLMLQTEMLAQDMNINIMEIRDLALQRYHECKDEFKVKNRSQYFI